MRQFERDLRARIVLKAFEQGAIRRDEVRKMLTKSGWELFESEDKEG